MRCQADQLVANVDQSPHLRTFIVLLLKDSTCKCSHAPNPTPFFGAPRGKKQGERIDITSIVRYFLNPSDPLLCSRAVIWANLVQKVLLDFPIPFDVARTMTPDFYHKYCSSLVTTFSDRFPPQQVNQSRKTDRFPPGQSIKMIDEPRVEFPYNRLSVCLERPQNNRLRRLYYLSSHPLVATYRDNKVRNKGSKT